MWFFGLKEFIYYLKMFIINIRIKLVTLENNFLFIDISYFIIWKEIHQNNKKYIQNVNFIILVLHFFYFKTLIVLNFNEEIFIVN